MNIQEKTVKQPGKQQITILGKPLIETVVAFGPLLGIIIFTVFMTIAAPRFLALRNIVNILYHASIFIVLAVGMTFVITGGGIDLSVGSTLALSGVLMCFYIKFTDYPPILGLFIPPIAGALLGVLNGLIIVKLKLPDFIATIATMIGYRGIVLIMAGGYSMYAFPPEVIFLGKYRLFDIFPISIIIAFLVAAFGHFLYKRTMFGRYTIAMGGNKKAAIMSGIKVDKYKVLNFAFMGLLAGLAGILTIGRLDAFHATYGNLMEIDTIAAVIIGGTYLYGGMGKIWGSIGGAVLLAMVTNGMVVLGLPYFYQYVAVAVVIILAVSLYTLSGKRV